MPFSPTGSAEKELGLAVINKSVHGLIVFVMDLWTAKMDQMKIGTCVQPGR